MKKDMRLRISAVEDYLKGSTLSRTAAKFNIHPVTLCRWVNRYRESRGNFYVKPWNRFEKKFEEKIMMLKEHNPALTLKKARQILKQEGISISVNGIYCIWSRYNLTKRPLEDPYSHYAALTPEIGDAMEFVRSLLKQNEGEAALKKAAGILNDMPSYPLHSEDVIKKIPERYLSLRRKLDRLYCLFTKIPIPLFYGKIRKLRKAMEEKGLRYSALIAGLSEMIALQWMDAPKDELKLYAVLKNKKASLRDPIMNFQLTFLAAVAYSELMKLKESWQHARKLRRLLNAAPLPVFFEAYGYLLTYLGDYDSALHFHEKALEDAKDTDMTRRLTIQVAIDLAICGEYRRALQFLRNVKMSDDDVYTESYATTHAFISFGLGKLDEASFFMQKTFEQAKKERFRNRIFTAACCLAAISRGLGKKEESADILRTYLKLMEKYRLKREILIMSFLLGKDLIKGRHRSLPTVNLLNLMQQLKHDQKAANYKQVIMHAKKFGISGYFHRCLIFFPELVLSFLEKGKDFELPAGILKLPVFNETAPVYHVQLLGTLRIFRNQKYLKITLDPLEQAVLIHIAYRLGAPEKHADVKSIFENFWPRSRHPAGRLAHVLVTLRKKLMMPAHLLRTRYSHNDRTLANEGFYVTSDHGDFNSYIAQARALERAGEWEFARENYLRAFRLFRGKPLKKNFDEWSLNARHRILTQVETEANNFAQSCLAHDNKKEAKWVLDKVLNIVPDSGNLNELVKQLLIT